MPGGVAPGEESARLMDEIGMLLVSDANYPANRTLLYAQVKGG